jgi:hypothetical protein
MLPQNSRLQPDSVGDKKGGIRDSVRDKKGGIRDSVRDKKGGIRDSVGDKKGGIQDCKQQCASPSQATTMRALV